MPFFRRRNELCDVPEELAKVGPALASAITRFNSALNKEAKASTRRVRRRAVKPPKLPAIQTPRRLPIPHRASAVGRPANAAASRAAEAVRGRLLALRRGLSRLRQRLGGH